MSVRARVRARRPPSTAPGSHPLSFSSKKKQGMDVSPVGIDIDPAGYNYQPSGLSVEPTRFGYTPTKVCYNPIKHVISEKVRVDLYHLMKTGDPTPDEDSDGCRRRLLRRL